MIGVQFVEIGGQAKDAASFAKLDATMAGCDEEGDYATTMLIWRNGDYLPTLGWSGTGGSTYFDGDVPDNEWLNLDLEETDDILNGYDAVWVKAGSAGSITILGEVPDGEITIPLSAGYNMVANPLPKAIKVSEFGKLSASMAGCDEEGDYATTMLVWKNGDYLPTFGWSGTGGSTYFDGDVPDNKWLNLDLEETDDVVEAGHGVWIKAGSAGSITFNAAD